MVKYSAIPPWSCAHPKNRRFSQMFSRPARQFLQFQHGRSGSTVTRVPAVQVTAHHHAGGLVPGRVRERDERVLAVQRVCVRAADAGHGHPDQRLAGARPRGGHGGHRDTAGSDHDPAHRRRHCLGAHGPNLGYLESWRTSIRREGALARQPTMADIARRAGVSRVAVSYALNGRPGVSDEAARADRADRRRDRASARTVRRRRCTAPPRGRSGLTMRRPSTAFHIEVFRRELISGVQSELMARGIGLALQFVDSLDDEIAVYRRWSADRRVGGVLLCDLQDDDPRVAAAAGAGAADGGGRRHR